MKMIGLPDQNAIYRDISLYETPLGLLLPVWVVSMMQMSAVD